MTTLTPDLATPSIAWRERILQDARRPQPSRIGPLVQLLAAANALLAFAGVSSAALLG